MNPKELSKNISEAIKKEYPSFYEDMFDLLVYQNKPHRHNDYRFLFRSDEERDIVLTIKIFYIEMLFLINNKHGNMKVSFSKSKREWGATNCNYLFGDFIFFLQTTVVYDATECFDIFDIRSKMAEYVGDYIYDVFGREYK